MSYSNLSIPTADPHGFRRWSDAWIAVVAAEQVANSNHRLGDAAADEAADARELLELEVLAAVGAGELGGQEAAQLLLRMALRSAAIEHGADLPWALKMAELALGALEADRPSVPG